MFEMINCPNCRYDETEHQCDFESGEEHVRCVRCGYYEHRTWNDEMSSDSGKEVLENSTGGGSGCFVYSLKEQPNTFSIGSVEDDTVDELKEALGTYDYCKYTFRKEGLWYLVDMINDIETTFEDGHFWNYEED